MRRVTTPPYSHWRTVKPVKFKTYNKKWRLVTVRRRYKSSDWWPADTLRDVLIASKSHNKQNGWSTNVKAGTVGSELVEIVRSTHYRTDNFTAEELDAPEGYGYWEVTSPETVRLTCVYPSDIERLEKSRKNKAAFRSHPAYRPPIDRPMPDGWVMDDKLSGWIEGRIGEYKFPDPQSVLAQSLSGKVNWEVEAAFGNEGHDKLVPLVFLRRAPRRKATWTDVASKSFDDSPSVLYRLLHYFQNRKKPFKIDDFYKQNLLRLHHPNGICYADLEFWKHEMAIRLTADKSLCESDKQESAISIVCGVPSSMDGQVEASVDVMDWYRLLIQLLETPVMIYSGNNFKV